MIVHLQENVPPDLLENKWKPHSTAGPFPTQEVYKNKHGHSSSGLISHGMLKCHDLLAGALVMEHKSCSVAVVAFPGLYSLCIYVFFL